MRARRVGQSMAQAQPRVKEITTRCQMASRPTANSKATVAYMQKVSVCEAMTRGRRPIRSASRPPNPPTSSEGMERQKPTRPTKPAESVNSRTNQPKTIISI